MRNSFPPAATTRRPSERGPATSKTCGIGSANGQTIGPDATPMTIDIAAISKITCSPDETPILAHHQGLQLPHRVEGDADHATASRPPVRKLLAKQQPISQKHPHAFKTLTNRRYKLGSRCNAERSCLSINPTSPDEIGPILHPTRSDPHGTPCSPSSS